MHFTPFFFCLIFKFSFEAFFPVQRSLTLETGEKIFHKVSQTLQTLTGA